MPDRDIAYESEARAAQRDPRAPLREAAPRQAAPPTDGPRLHRRRRVENPLHIDPRIIPSHMSYEWKRVELLGKPDGEHMVGLRENHWRAVPAARHPELAGAGDTIIRRGDVVLHERPKYLTDEAHMEDLQEGLRPVQQMEEVMFGTKPEELTRDHPSVRRISKVNQRYAAADPYGAAPGGDDGLSSEP